MSLQLQILLVAYVTAISCSLVGVYLFLKRMVLISDAISHSMLLGIVVFAFLTQSLSSPLLLFGAGLSGLLLIAAVELLNQTNLLGQSRAIGIVYPFLFSLAIIGINVFGSNLHIDTQVVLLGEIAFTPFEQTKLFGRDLGPQALYVGGFLCLLNASVLFLFRRQLNLTTFDPLFATTLGVSPVLFHYLLMGLVAFTTVGAFKAVGSILVVALIVAPPASAFLLTKRMKPFVALSLFLSVASSTLGVALAFLLNLSITGTIAVVMGIVFATCALASPSQGVVVNLRRRHLQRSRLLENALLVHLLNHEGKPEEVVENTFGNLLRHFRWQRRLAERVVHSSVRQGWVEAEGDSVLRLTKKGRERVLGSQAML